MNESGLLFTKILNCDYASLYLNQDLHLDRSKSSLIASVLKRRITGEPIEYILGETEFMGLKFKVNPDVFIPRPETEILVETAVSLVQSSETRVQGILDIGTGSGCIAVSLAKLLRNVEITATDISQEALKIAKYNGILNEVNHKIRFINSDLFNNYELRTMNYELILSNPPYISTLGFDNLQPEISYEPRIALDGGKDGLDFYRKIIGGSAYYLEQNGYLIMEMGFGQSNAVKNIFQKSRNFEIIEVVKDYQNIDRVIVTQRKKKDG